MQIPHNWSPRWYQQKAWDYMTGGVVDPRASDDKHAELIWHRRAGKDDICLHFAAREMLLNPATYWHMLPQANQVKKAIWLAVNSHSGKRRIEEAFPKEIFSYNESDMMVKCKANASTWQCLGSDNYDSAVGSPPRGITYSEWALANPSVRGYLRPIIAENHGWQLFITTPRGKNHAYQTYNAASKNPSMFAERLSVHDTGLFTKEKLMEELHFYVDTYGEMQGIAMFEQELECSWEAAVLGAYYGSEFRDIDRDGRITTVPHDPNHKVHVAMDIGYDDDTAMWWFQVIGGEIRVLEYHYNSGKDPDYYCSQLLGRDVEIVLSQSRIVVNVGQDVRGLDHRRNYTYGTINLPHDAKARTFAAKGKSVHEQFAQVFGWGVIQIVPRLSIEDGIQASRKVLKRCVFDTKCLDGIECLREYQREWDDTKKMFKDAPLHDWTSHGADGFRYLAVSYSEKRIKKEDEDARYAQDRTFSELVALNTKSRRKRENY